MYFTISLSVFWLTALAWPILLKRDQHVATLLTLTYFDFDDY
ncbi:MAG TPA: hypothetical protein VKA27_18760 [Sunxiuqinia sp.]|nr:hypothetical protein [Sunxiuqinia sp.]